MARYIAASSASSHISARCRAATLAALALLVICGRATAGEVVIVRTSDAEPYTQAEAAVRQRLGELHHTCRTVLAKTVSETGIDATIGKCDAVLAIGTPAARWLHQQLPATARLIYCMVADPAEAGLSQGADCWGVTTNVAVADELRLVAEALPRARTLGTLYRSDVAESRDDLKTLRDALPEGWKVEAVAVNDFPSVAAAIDSLTQKNPDLIWTTGDQRLYDTACVRALLLGALRNKIPVWGFSSAFVRAGALIGVAVEPRAQGAQAADIADAVLTDVKQIKQKAQPPRQFQTAVNLIVARQIGVEIPDSLLRRAAFVFRPENK